MFKNTPFSHTGDNYIRISSIITKNSVFNNSSAGKVSVAKQHTLFQWPSRLTMRPDLTGSDNPQDDPLEVGAWVEGLARLSVDRADSAKMCSPKLPGILSIESGALSQKEIVRPGQRYGCCSKRLCRSFLMAYEVLCRCWWALHRISFQVKHLVYAMSRPNSHGQYSWHI